MMLATRMRMSGLEVPNVSLVHTTSSLSVNSDTWTVSGADFGDIGIGRTRYLIAVVTCNDDDTDDDAFSAAISIGGVSATVVGSGVGPEEPNTGAGGVFIAIAAVPTGLSGDVVTTLSDFVGTMDAFGLALYRAVGLNSATPTTTPTGTTDITLVVPSNGFGVVGAAVAAFPNGNAGAFSGSDAVTAYSGSRAGAAMLRTVAGSVVHDSANASVFRGATWEFL